LHVVDYAISYEQEDVVLLDLLRDLDKLCHVGYQLYDWAEKGGPIKTYLFQ
jgi:hypothetical protein